MPVAVAPAECPGGSGSVPPSHVPWPRQPGFPKGSGALVWLIGLLPDGPFPGVIDPISASKLDREASWLITMCWVENQIKEVWGGKGHSAAVLRAGLR